MNLSFRSQFLFQVWVLEASRHLLLGPGLLGAGPSMQCWRDLWGLPIAFLRYGSKWSDHWWNEDCGLWKAVETLVSKSVAEFRGEFGMEIVKLGYFRFGWVRLVQDNTVWFQMIRPLMKWRLWSVKSSWDPRVQVGGRIRRWVWNGVWLG